LDYGRAHPLLADALKTGSEIAAMRIGGRNSTMEATPQCFSSLAPDENGNGLIDAARLHFFFDRV
jgi:hypothetical protein